MVLSRLVCEIVLVWQADYQINFAEGLLILVENLC